MIGFSPIALNFVLIFCSQSQPKTTPPVSPPILFVVVVVQGSYSIEKPLNITACLEKSLISHKAWKSP